MTAERKTESYLQTTPLTEVEFLQVSAMNTVVHRAQDHPMLEMATVFDETFTALFPELAARDITPVGPALSLHHRMPTDTATFEVGIPVEPPLENVLTAENGVSLEPSTLPAGTIARISYLGPYEGLGEAWTAFMQAIAAHGKQPELPFWEVYVTEPSPEIDPATMRTDLYTLIS